MDSKSTDILGILPHAAAMLWLLHRYCSASKCKPERLLPKSAKTIGLLTAKCREGTQGGGEGGVILRRIACELIVLS